MREHRVCGRPPTRATLRRFPPGAETRGFVIPCHSSGALMAFSSEIAPLSDFAFGRLKPAQRGGSANRWRISWDLCVLTLTDSSEAEGRAVRAGIQDCATSPMTREITR